MFFYRLEIKLSFIFMRNVRSYVLFFCTGIEDEMEISKCHSIKLACFLLLSMSLLVVICCSAIVKVSNLF